MNLLLCSDFLGMFEFSVFEKKEVLGFSEPKIVQVFFRSVFKHKHYSTILLIFIDGASLDKEKK